VEHYGKGAPPGDVELNRPRPVTAVTGAFVSADRDWFERLGGFSVDYIFGHYEDADLCLRSLDAGTAVWMQPIPLYHLEGKGSTRLPAHEGGSLFNRWLFTSRWGDRPDLLGREPRHPALA
jgi:GT2 family glycosyltransferase